MIGLPSLQRAGSFPDRVVGPRQNSRGRSPVSGKRLAPRFGVSAQEKGVPNTVRGHLKVRGQPGHRFGRYRMQGRESLKERMNNVRLPKVRALGRVERCRFRADQVNETLSPWRIRFPEVGFFGFTTSGDRQRSSCEQARGE